jgi:HSP20 family protein
MADLKRWSQGEITRMRLEIDRLFDELCSDFDLPAMVCHMAGDIRLWEEEGSLVVTMELHAMSPDDVSVVVLERLLVVTAEVEEVVRGRRRSRSFRKEVRLPCAIRTDAAEIGFSEGVLEIRLPKCGLRPARVARPAGR